MKLFQPNNLSRHRPEFTQLTDPAIFNEIVSLLKEHYALPALSELKISVFSGPNISSQNFKLETPETKAFLKARTRSGCEKLLREAGLTFALGELGQRVPRIIRSRRGELVCTHDDKCFVLYEFREGNYFSGNNAQLQSAADCFAELSLAAKQLFPSVTAKPDAFPDGLPELLCRARTSDLAAVCAEHETFIFENLALVEKHRNLLDRPGVPMHLDYHPLNLLLHEDQIACIIDLEHLQPYPVAVGLGFAAYKLIRQAMVDDNFRARELSDPAAVSIWLRAWQKRFPEDNSTASDLGIGARSRILKLIQLILDAYLNQHDHRYIYDLEKQIVSLYEVEEIFSRKGAKRQS